MLLLILSFIAGALTVLAPCILPLLPVIIGGSLSGDVRQKSRPYIIVGSLVVSLIAFTLLLKVSTALLNVDPMVWVYVSGGLVVALGLTSLFPGVWEQIIGRFGWQAHAQALLGVGFKNKGQFVGPVIIGLALGPVFSSCSPTFAFILATVLPRDLASGLLYLATYCLGLALVLLGISVFGQRFIAKFSWATDPHGLFRRGLGILFIIVGLAIITGWDKRSEMWLADHLPFNISVIEQKLFSQSRTSPDSNNNSGSLTANDVFNVEPTPAPELTGLNTWINSSPQTLASLSGKVVLVDFWTYSCINCMRTLPYIEKWYETYKDKGFVVIGVHAPEFAFERVESNVRKAVQDDKLTYPIALDNNYATWRAFNNQYWPAHYLIDKQGNIRQTHFGEGDYDKAERAIQLLLGDNRPLVTSSDSGAQSTNITPETYLGTARAVGYEGSPALTDGDHTYSQPASLDKNHWTLAGSWHISPEGITSQQNAKLKYKVNARDVYLVVASSASNQLGITVDGAPSTVDGETLTNGNLQINGARLYHIAHLPKLQESTVEITAPPGVILNTFTFGG